MHGALTCNNCGAYHRMVPVIPVKQDGIIIRSEWKCRFCGLRNVINHERNDDGNTNQGS